jgi:CRISPR/Cas system-associated exonuclease Cas4 (RecB family)
MLEFQLPAHASHSAINNYLRCGKAYELGKLGVKEAPAWWLLGGSAVHKATEWLDKGEWDEAPEFAFYLAFQQEIEQTLEVYPNQDAWRKAGYGARAQGYEHWIQQGPRYVKQWADRGEEWRQVELDVSTTLPSGIVIKGYIDRARRVSKHEGYQFVDLKTGSTRPDSDQQLGIYKVLFDLWLNENSATRHIGGGDIRAFNYMFKDDEFYEMDVSSWTLQTVDEIAQEWLHGVQSSVFLPNRGKQCGSCGLSSACYLASGDSNLTRKFDRLNPHYGK